MEFRTILSAKILQVFVENNDSRIVLAKTTKKNVLFLRRGYKKNHRRWWWTKIGRCQPAAEESCPPARPSRGRTRG